MNNLQHSGINNQILTIDTNDLSYLSNYYRYKKLIGDSLIEGGKDSGGYEYVSAMNYEHNFKKFKNTIENTVLYFI